MAYTAYWYGKGIENIFNGTIDIDSDTLNCALLDSGYTPAQDTDEDFSVIDADEVSGDGYVAGGAELTGVSLTYTAGTNILNIDADDVSWADSTITARYAVIYSSTADKVICYINFGEDKSSTSNLFRIEFNSGGIAKVTLS